MSEKKRTIKDYAFLVAAGFSMGAANVIPGVSGGTMAFILGIYEELISSIRQFASFDTFKLLIDRKFKRLYDTLPWPFLLAIAAGVAVALKSLAKVLSHLLDKYPELTYAFFFGLVLASIVCCFKLLHKWNNKLIVPLVLGAAAAYFTVTLIPVQTPHTWWFLIICGMIIICAMILPGISGSFLLLILGQYNHVLKAITNFREDPGGSLITLGCLGIGCVIGLGCFVHLLNYLFKRFHDLTVVTLIGFMVGSLWKIWPWKHIVEYTMKHGERVPLIDKNVWPAMDMNFVWALALIVTGIAIVIALEYIASRKKTAVAS